MNRALEKVLIGDGCWEWVGNKNQHGYGRTTANGRRTVAHRFIYEMLRGPVGSQLQLDHLCRNKGCVNPDHMEPVSAAVNTRRAALVRPRKAKCKRGHLLDHSNTYEYVRRNGVERRCRKCYTASNSAWRERERGYGKRRKVREQSA